MKRLLSAALLKQQKAQGKTINLASHSAADIAQACDMVYEMADGSRALAELAQGLQDEVMKFKI